MKKLVSSVIAFGLLAGCTHIKGVVAIQPSNAVDTPKVWVHIITDDASVSGVYRCTDEGSEKGPICKKAALQ